METRYIFTKVSPLICSCSAILLFFFGFFLTKISEPRLRFNFTNRSRSTFFVLGIKCTRNFPHGSFISILSRFLLIIFIFISLYLYGGPGEESLLARTFSFLLSFYERRIRFILVNYTAS